MGFLDRVKRRPTSVGLGNPARDGAGSALTQKTEPQLGLRSAAEAPDDADVRRMARSFEALYSPSPSAADPSSSGQNDDNDFLALMTNEHRAASRRSETELFDRARDSRASTEREARAVATGGPAAEKKTSIELAFEMLRATEERRKSAALREEPVLRAEPSEASHVDEVPEVRELESRSAYDALLAHEARQQMQQPAHDRAFSTKALAGAGIALLIGTAIGYVAGHGLDPFSSRHEIESTDIGVRLRLDSELRGR
jgi:hypothetical protein